MNLKGSCQIGASPAAVIAGLTDPALLRAILPELQEITPAGTGGHTLDLRRSFGPVSVRLKGHYALAVNPDSSGPHHMKLDLRGPFGAACGIDLALKIQPTLIGCILSHEGTLQTRGLIRRLLAEQAGRVQAGLDGRITAFSHALHRSLVARG